MSDPFGYSHIEPLAFGGVKPVTRSYDDSQAVILPVPLDQTTSYVSGTRHAPREILHASSFVELWDEELQTDVHGVGIYTLPVMDLPIGDLRQALDEIQRAAAAVIDRGKFLVVLGGEHSITPAVTAAVARRHAGLSVLQIDAHADLRESYMGSPWSHACAMRRTLEHARCTQVGIRSLSQEEFQAIPSLATTVFYDTSMRRDPRWIDRVVESLGPTVYVTIDCDGLDPAVMPAVGTPEPGGLSWWELLSLLRATFTRRTVVGCDLVELCPIPGLVAPNFVCARLIYKMLTYRFAGRDA